MGGPGGGDVASFLLSHTGELKLSDQQVTRLAAIARRSADRRQAVMRSMDSLMARGPMPGGFGWRGGPGGPAPRFRGGPPPRGGRGGGVREAPDSTGPGA